MITYTNRLNMTPGRVPLVIHVSQYDSDFQLVFTLYSSDGTFTIESGTTAMIRGTKTDGHAYDADTTVDINNQTVTVTGDVQMTAAKGMNVYELVLQKSGKDLATANFILAVEKAAMDADTIASESVLKEINALINGASTATEAAARAESAASSVSASAAQIETNKTDIVGLKSDVTNVKADLDVVNPATKLSWTLKKSINTSGVITSSNYTALTDFVRKCGKVTIVRKSPQKDSNKYALSFMVSQFNEDTFISRTNLQYPGNSITLDADCTRYAIAFGRSSGSGTVIQQTDIDTYFDADIYNEADSFKYGIVSTDTTSLASVTVPGCYRLNLANYANLTDLPTDFPTNRVTMLINLQLQENIVLQSIVDGVEGHLWIRRVNTTTADTSEWQDIHNSHYLIHTENADADNAAWNGWYGWGSTEAVTNVPSTVGMLLNVVRTADTKYQLAFDHINGDVYTRNSKSSVWTDWKRLAFASEIPTTGKAINIRHESGRFADGAATERLHVYVPAETGYILYLMYHFVDASNNSDVWQIYNAYQVDDNFDYASRKTLTVTGEWECAIHLNGRDDFSGGHTHGDEMMRGDAVFLVDGVPVTISDLSTLTPCNELRIIRSSIMYDPADHTTAIADHGVEYEYKKDGVTIDQSLKWLVAEPLTNCFLSMFLPSKNYIDRAAANNDFVVESLPSETGTPLTTITKPNSNGVTMWDTASGMFANVAVPVYPSGLSGGDKMTIHDNDNKQYNKVYFYVCTGGSSAVGELWKSKSIYKIGYRDTTN